MKRILLVVGVVCGLGAVGLTAAHADNTGESTKCTDSYPAGQTAVPGTGLSFETGSGPGSITWAGVCYSTTPHGSSSPEATGGNVFVYSPDQYGNTRLLCRGDRATGQSVVVDCDMLVTRTDPSSAPGTTASGSAKVGTTGPVPVGQTGAEANPQTTTNGVMNSNTPGGGGSAGIGAGTCTWVNGTQSCPFGTGATVANVTVYEGDLPTVTPTNSSPPPACTGVNNTCPGAYVVVGGDTSHDTINTQLGETPIRRDVPLTCVQVNSVCPS